MLALACQPTLPASMRSRLLRTKDKYSNNSWRLSSLLGQPYRGGPSHFEGQLETIHRRPYPRETPSRPAQEASSSPQEALNTPWGKPHNASVKPTLGFFCARYIKRNEMPRATNRRAPRQRRSANPPAVVGSAEERRIGWRKGYTQAGTVASENARRSRTGNQLLIQDTSNA